MVKKLCLQTAERSFTVKGLPLKSGNFAIFGVNFVTCPLTCP